jgi:hypothetical protein
MEMSEASRARCRALWKHSRRTRYSAEVDTRRSSSLSLPESSPAVVGLRRYLSYAASLVWAQVVVECGQILLGFCGLAKVPGGHGFIGILAYAGNNTTERDKASTRWGVGEKCRRRVAQRERAGVGAKGRTLARNGGASISLRLAPGATPLSVGHYKQTETNNLTV